MKREQVRTNLSFVIIAYNEESNLPDTLDSILGQEGLERFEVIVVNDGSTDHTADVVRDVARAHPEVRLLDLQPNRGRGAARLAGAQATNGDYVAFVDADIVLPRDWLTVCLRHIAEYDAVGGMAVPDGDVAFLYRRFALHPKVIRNSYPITGSNCLFRHALLDTVAFDHRLREGEDVDLNNRLLAAGYKLHRITDLIVRHEESISFLRSCRWMFQIGVGATRQLNVYRHIRIPDLTYFGFLIIAVLSVSAAVLLGNYAYLILTPSWILITSLLHVMSRFRSSLAHTPRLLLASIANSCLIASYYCGRSYGYIKFGGARRADRS